jgi:acetylornithine aminotransferase/acetylornithine/N-succinyldiaminopimelate aminotransferase
MIDPATLSTDELFRRYVMPTYGRFPVKLVRGEGAWVWDEAGKRYLDFGAGIAVCSVGHCHPRVVGAMRDQLGKLIHTSNLYFTRPQGLLAKRLVEMVGVPGRVFFCNSGAEANEALIKMARRFGHETVHPDGGAGVRHEIITFRGSFHGRTMAGISATGQEKVKIGFDPLLAGFAHVAFGDIGAVREAITPETVAVLVEPIQGESGIRPATGAFLRELRECCDERGLLLLFDEVQCGLGRTGAWCGWKRLSNEGVAPDGVSWAKGIAGGFPLGAAWVRDRRVELKTGGAASLSEVLGPGSHGSTFGGNALVCTGALEVLDVIEREGLLENARSMGDRALDGLRAIRSKLIEEVRGVGLMIGIQLAPDFADRIETGGRAPSLFLVDRLHEAGLLAVPSGTDCVRWLPPLNVSSAEIEQALDITATALQNLPSR